MARARRDPPSLAECLRAHRAAFELAQELGITPRDAEAELARRKARANWSAKIGALAHRRRTGPVSPPPGEVAARSADGGAQPAPATPDPEQPARPWWQRD